MPRGHGQCYPLRYADLRGVRVNGWSARVLSDKHGRDAVQGVWASEDVSKGGEMKSLIIVIVLLASLASVAQLQPHPTLAECKVLSHAYSNIPLDSMTAYEEMLFTTRLQNCVNDHDTSLTGGEAKGLNKGIYYLDLDRSLRMFNFLERHGLLSTFDAEEEAQKVLRTQKGK